MGRYVFKMPDLGEGTVEAEVVAWHVELGQWVEEDQVMAEVMTEKAAVEVPAPVSGRVVVRNGQPGDMIPVGSELIVFETEAEEGGKAAEGGKAEGGKAAGAEAPAVALAPTAAAASTASTVAPVAVSEATGGRVKASPATRRRAREAGVDLRSVAGSGPGGRITRQDFDETLATRALTPAPGAATVGGSSGLRAPRTGTEEVKVIGVRRVIAQRLQEVKRNVPHFAYVEEVDVTELESLRVHMNERRPAGAGSLSYLPFIGLALARVLEDFPQCNAHYDAERNVLVRHRGVHLGIATQTPDGLKVPVVRHVEAMGLWTLATEIRRVTEAARDGKAAREELSGSTITLTSLGKLGGIVSTPILNAPEVSIVGVNKAIERPVVLGGAIAIRRIMNLSSSFDHRFVDGYDAAAMIQALKERLEHPATIFITG